MKSKILLISLVAVLALSLGLVGCSSTPVTPTTTSIKIAYPGGFTGLSSVDPCNFFYGGPDNPNIFETLVGQNASEALVPLLATSWSWSPDGLCLTVNLRHGVVFSSGDNFTADDVIFSLNRHLQYDMPVQAQLSPGQGFLNCTEVDPYTVKFYFSKKNVQFVPQTLVMMGITSKTYYDRVGETAYLNDPVGTGPYKIDSWVAGAHIDVSYNDKYRGAKPQIDSAEYIVYSSPATGVNMLKTGEVDLLSQAPGSSITELQTLGFNYIPVTQAHALALVFNMLAAGTPWDNVKVRQAIDYAIDKYHIAGSLICGPIQEGTWALPTAPWYDPSLKPAYAYNLTTATQLMQEAGYLSGFSLNITYLATETVTPLADYLASALAAINITVHLNAISGMPDFMNTIANIHNIYFAHNATPTPVSPNAFLYDPGWPGNPEVAIDLTNGFYAAKDNTLFDDSTINGLVDQVLSAVDDTTRWNIAKTAWSNINALLPAIPIGQEVQTNFSKANVVYIKSVGNIMVEGPRQLVDLRVVSP